MHGYAISDDPCGKEMIIAKLSLAPTPALAEAELTHPLTRPRKYQKCKIDCKEQNKSCQAILLEPENIFTQP